MILSASNIHKLKLIWKHIVLLKMQVYAKRYVKYRVLSTFKGLHLHDWTLSTKFDEFSIILTFNIFSDIPLEPNEKFQIQISGIETGWSGHLRLVLTNLNPDRIPRPLPASLADLHAWCACITTRGAEKMVGESAPGEAVALLPSSPGRLLPTEVCEKLCHIFQLPIAYL